jgi:two-component system chemotaxis response regulator CheY
MKILLVEDDISQRTLLRHIITKRMDSEIFEAKNGIEGLRMVEMNSPNLIILDVWMPVMNGMAMLDKLRADKTHKSIPVVIITAMKDQETIQEAISKGISGYILKPFTPELVYAALSKFIPSFQTVEA